MIDIDALVAGQKAVDDVQNEIKDRILRDVPTAEDPSVYFKLMGRDYDIEVMTSNELSEDAERRVSDIIEAVQMEFGMYPALKGGLTIEYTTP